MSARKTKPRTPRAGARRERAPLPAYLAGLRVKDIMTEKPVCGSPEDSLESLREIMNKDHIRYLPVKEGDKLLGVISFHDVANAVIKETTFHNRLLKSYIKNWPEETVKRES